MQTLGGDRYIKESIQIDAPITIENKGYGYGIYYEGYQIGRLSNASAIAQKLKALGKNKATGFFVSDVCVWRYEDVLKSDALKHTTFAKDWGITAKNIGFVHVVQIAGIGQ